MKLSDKIVFITGASSGIGQACAQTFAQAGAKLILAARRLDKLEAIAKQCQQDYDTETLCLQLDITDLSAVENALQQLTNGWEQIDILINNAGLAAGLSSIDKGDIDDWQRMIDTNIKGLLFMTRYILPLMVKRNCGHVINIGSIAGHEVYPNGAVYCATKHAVNAISRGIKMDLLETDIRVTTIDPGMVDTEFSLVRFAGDKERAAAVYKDMQPLQASDIADACCYAATRPAHVNISEIIILATDQGSATSVHRHKES